MNPGVTVTTGVSGVRLPVRPFGDDAQLRILPETHQSDQSDLDRPPAHSSIRELPAHRCRTVMHPPHWSAPVCCLFFQLAVRRMNMQETVRPPYRSARRRASASVGEKITSDKAAPPTAPSITSHFMAPTPGSIPCVCVCVCVCRLSAQSDSE